MTCPRPPQGVHGPGFCPVCPPSGRIRPHPGIPAGAVAESSIPVEKSACPRPNLTTRRRPRVVSAIRARRLHDPTRQPRSLELSTRPRGHTSPRDPRSCVLPWSGWRGSRVEDPAGTPKAPLTHATPTSTIHAAEPANHADVCPREPRRRLPSRTTPTFALANHADVCPREPRRRLPSRTTPTFALANHADVCPREPRRRLPSRTTPTFALANHADVCPSRTTPAPSSSRPRWPISRRP